MYSIFSSRVASIDCLRGLVVFLMIFDHIRGEFYQYGALYLSDPVDLEVTDPSLAFLRIVSHLCAPIFVFLAGTSVFLLESKGEFNKKDISLYLLKRGVLLMILEVTLITFSWDLWIPILNNVYIQVIFCLGISMVILSALIWLPKSIIIFISLVAIVGANTLADITVPPESSWFILWKFIYSSGWLDLSGGYDIKVSYPILPWSALMLMGYGIGRYMYDKENHKIHENIVLYVGASLVLIFFALRYFNLYGGYDAWQEMPSTLYSLISFFNLSKYPVSLHFMFLTLGIGALMLWGFEKIKNQPFKFTKVLQTYGREALFLYVSHLLILEVLHRLMVSIVGPTNSDEYVFSSVLPIYILGILLIWPLYYLCLRYEDYKKENTHKKWLKYF